MSSVRVSWASPRPALLLRFFYTCRGTEAAMSSSCVKNVDSVSEPKSKINEANSNNELLIGDIFGAFSTLKLFSTVLWCYIQRLVHRHQLHPPELYEPTASQPQSAVRAVP